MARVHFVKKARKANKNAGIKKGDSYYWWKCGRHCSKTPPKRSQLTRSAFYSTVYDIEDDMVGGATADDGLADVRGEIVSALQELRDECESSRENMPESLQESETGQLLQDRIDALESAIDEFEALNLDDPGDDLELEEGQSKEDAIQAYWEDKLEELQGISIEAP